MPSGRQGSGVPFRFSISGEQEARKIVEAREGVRETEKHEAWGGGGGRQKRVPTFCEGYKKSSRLRGHPTI